MLGVERPVGDRVPFVDGGVLRMTMPDGALERAHSRAGIDALPEEM